MEHGSSTAGECAVRFAFRDNEYDITADDNSWILSEVTTVQAGEKAGEEKLRNRRYFASLETLLVALFEVSLRKEDAEALVELAETAKELRREIRQAFGSEGLLEDVAEAEGEGLAAA